MLLTFVNDRLRLANDRRLINRLNFYHSRNSVVSFQRSTCNYVRHVTFTKVSNGPAILRVACMSRLGTINLRGILVPYMNHDDLNCVFGSSRFNGLITCARSIIFACNRL